ncbi:NitT/TauT family transport system permease protein [Neisseria sp. HSC-16F19]|nr:ABC transporter permease [Neisseria sp. HSC-16F19]MCP2040223.1 NitT/TauT family transport system permease protein [Neisseria sp. HSC-16F19]
MSRARWHHFGYAVAGLLLLLIVWQIGAWLLMQSVPLARTLRPEPTLTTLYHLLGGAEIYQHIIASLRRVLVSLLLALAIGVPVGLLLGQSRLFEALFGGNIQLLRMISPLSWMPVAVMLFGIGDAPVYFLLTFAAVWPVILNTATGVRSIDPAWHALGASLSATRSETLRHIVLPAVLGHILTGVRLAIGVLWIVLVPCEMLGVNDGLGYFILDTRDRLAYSELGATIVLIGVLGWMLDAGARWLHQRWA